jgi:hypothetical protein
MFFYGGVSNRGGTRFRILRRTNTHPCQPKADGTACVEVSCSVYRRTHYRTRNVSTTILQCPSLCVESSTLLRESKNLVGRWALHHRPSHPNVALLEYRRCCPKGQGTRRAWNAAFPAPYYCRLEEHSSDRQCRPCDHGFPALATPRPVGPTNANGKVATTGQSGQNGVGRRTA